MAVYRHDYEAFGRLVLNAPWMVAHMVARAERGKAYAEVIAPFDPKDEDGSHYMDCFEVTSGTHGGLHHDRAYATLANTNSVAREVEYGSKHNHAHRVLGKAMEVMR